MRIINRVDSSYHSLEKNYDEEITILNDISAIMDDKHEGSVAWLNESPDILESFWNSEKSFFDSMCEHLSDPKRKFTKLYTHDKRYAYHPDVKIVQPATPSWVEEENRFVHEKSKDVTFITSTKKYTPTQVARVTLAQKLINLGVPVYGRGTGNAIDSKGLTLKPYRFCFAIENGKFAGYHSEKVLDCFLTGTVPIYYGDPDIGDLFDTSGMIIIDQKFDFEKSLKTLTPERYEDMLEGVHKNFEVAMNYTNTAQDVMKIILEDYEHND